MRDKKFLDSNRNSIPVIEEEVSKTVIDTLFDNMSNSSADISEEPILSTPERPSGSLLEERDNGTNTSSHVCKEPTGTALSSGMEASTQFTINSEINTDSISEQPNIPERLPSLNNPSVLDTNVYMIDAKVAGINAQDEFDSLEDITVYEVVTEYPSAPQISTANYPHIFLQLRNGKIINVENGEIIINLSQFVATNESAEPPVSDTTSMLSSQASPRPLHIDNEYITSTQESTTGVAKGRQLWKKCTVDGRFDYVEELILRDPQSILVGSGSPSCTF